MRTVKLITCNESFQARLIKGALENEGIAVAIHNENTSSVLRGMPVSITGIDLFVYEDDYEKAMSILLRKKHRLRAIVSTVITMLAAAPPGTEHWEYTCKDCRRTFDKPAGKSEISTENDEA